MLCTSWPKDAAMSAGNSTAPCCAAAPIANAPIRPRTAPPELPSPFPSPPLAAVTESAFAFLPLDAGASFGVAAFGGAAPLAEVSPLGALLLDVVFAAGEDPNRPNNGFGGGGGGGGGGAFGGGLNSPKRPLAGVVVEEEEEEGL